LYFVEGRDQFSFVDWRVRRQQFDVGILNYLIKLTAQIFYSSGCIPLVPIECLDREVLTLHKSWPNGLLPFTLFETLVVDVL
jgi:hypothetical protein